jgi:hypothetical protein
MDRIRWILHCRGISPQEGLPLQGRKTCYEKVSGVIAKIEFFLSIFLDK